MTRPLLLGALVGVVIAASSPARAGTYYVGKSGCSNSGPGSKGQPWCSVNTGVNKLNAGDTLYVGAGTYKEKVKIKRSGSSGKPITLAAAPGAKPVIDGKGQSLYESGVLEINTRKHITVRGLTWQNSSYYCVLITDSTNIIFEKNYVSSCYHGGVVVDEGSSYIKVLGNDVQKTDQCGKGCGTHEAITISETDHFEVANNYVHHGVKEGIDCKDASSDGTVHHNTVANMGQVGIYLNHCVNVKFYRNNVHHNGSSGFQLAVGDYAMGTKKTDNNHIYQNLSWSNGYCGIEYWAEGSGTMSNNRIYNNVFYNNGHYGMQMSDDDSQVKGTIIRNNIIMDNSLGGIVGSARKNATISHNLFQGNSSQGSSVVKGNPMFVNQGSGNFNLKAGSPAIDKGYDMGLPKKNAQDIGAYEYGYTPPKLDKGVPPKLDKGVPPKKDKGVPKKDKGAPKKDKYVKPPPGQEASVPPPADAGHGADPTLEGACGCETGGAAGGPVAVLVVVVLVLALRRRRG